MKKIILILLMICTFAMSGCSNEQKIDKQIAQMSLQDKISQMIMPSLRYSFYEVTEDENGSKKTNTLPLQELDEKYTALLNEYKFGGFIFFAGNLSSSEKSFELIRQIKQAHGEEGIPLFMAADQEGGFVTRIGFGTTMPGNMALCASNDPQNAYESSNIIGSEMKMLGLNLDFSPVVDINSNPNNPIIGVRSFSDNCEYEKEYIEKSIEGYHQQNVLVSLKHFPGHGDTAVDPHTGLPQVDKTYEQIRNNELKAFEYGIEAGADIIMSAHIMFPNIDSSQYIALNGQKVYLPATLSKKILGMLREDLGFEGIIITDSLAMDAIKNYYDRKDAAKLAINAGADMLLMPIDYHESVDTYIRELKDYVKMIVKMVEDGEIEESTIDESVRRILTLKYEKHLNNRTNEIENLSSLLGSKESHEMELEIAKKAITMVENSGVCLPLDRNKKTLFLVPYKSQGNAVKFAYDQLLARDLIGYDSLNYYVFGGDDSKSFDYELIEKFDNIVLTSSMYGFEDICDEYSAIIDSVLKLCKEKGKTGILVSAHLPYDLSRFEADLKVACYLGAGPSVIPEDYSKDVVSYQPNLTACIIHLYESGVFDGKLPLDIPVLEYDEKNNTYSAAEQIRYYRGFGLTE